MAIRPRRRLDYRPLRRRCRAPDCRDSSSQTSASAQGHDRSGAVASLGLLDPSRFILSRVATRTSLSAGDGQRHCAGGCDHGAGRWGYRSYRRGRDSHPQARQLALLVCGPIVPCRQGARNRRGRRSSSPKQSDGCRDVGRDFGVSGRRGRTARGHRAGADSANTVEGALFAKPILQAHSFWRVLLVTSARHMPRAVAIFRAAGIDVTPVSSDAEAALELRHTWSDFIPDAGAMHQTSQVLHEYLGLLVYPLQMKFARQAHRG